MAIVYLLPRASTEWTPLQRWQGDADLPLSVDGIRQAEGYACRLSQLSRDDAQLDQSDSGSGLLRMVKSVAADVTRSSVLRGLTKSHPPCDPTLKPSSSLWGVISGPNLTAVRTAEIVCDKLDLTHRVEPAVKEVCLGLWQGLTPEELAQRHQRVFRTWQDDPSAVTPPHGENLMSAYTRLCGVLSRVTRKFEGRQVALVLGPLATALVRMAVERAHWSNFWDLATEPAQVHRLTLPERVHAEQLAS